MGIRLHRGFERKRKMHKCDDCGRSLRKYMSADDTHDLFDCVCGFQKRIPKDYKLKTEKLGIEIKPTSNDLTEIINN